MRKEPTIPRLMRKVHMPNLHDCWLWTAGLNSQGYGSIRDGKHMAGAHRVLYEHLFGPVGSLQLDHLCRVRSCVNPFHLEPVTPVENLRRGAGQGMDLYVTKTVCPRGHQKKFFGDRAYPRWTCIVCARPSERRKRHDSKG